MVGPQIEPGTIITGGEAPPWATAGASSSPAGAPSPPAGQVFSGGEIPPWQQARDLGLVADASSATQSALDRPIPAFLAPDSGTIGGWLAQAGRSTTMTAFDPISALEFKWRMRDEIPDMTYAESLKAVQDGWDAEYAITADIGGALVPGIGIAKGVSVLGAKALTKTGMMDGAMRWAARQPKLANIVRAAGEGAAGGAIFEGIRTGLDETISVGAGEAFDPQRVTDAVLAGGLLGAITGGGVQALARGGGPVPGFMDVVESIGSLFNIGPQQNQQAMTQIYRALRSDPSETPEALVTRLREARETFKQERGYEPALMDLADEFQTREVLDVARYWKGLDVPVFRMSEEALERQMTSFRGAINSGAPLKSPEELTAQTSRMFAEVIRRDGDTLVDVSDDVLDALAPLAGWVKTMALTPDGAKMARILDANKNIGAVSMRADNLRRAATTAGMREELTKLGDDIAFTRANPAGVAAARDEVNSLGGGRGDEGAMGAMQNFYAQLARQIDNIKATDTGLVARQKRDAVDATLDGLDRTIKQYKRDGLKITLRSANELRMKASKAARNPGDPTLQAQSVAVRDVLSTVGTAEVPRYGRMVKLFSEGMTRAEAQVTGAAAAKGQLNLKDLKTRLETGRLPNRKGRASMDPMLRGVREGAILSLGDEATGTVSQTLSAARRISEAPIVRDSLDMVAPAESRRITGGARATVQTADNVATARVVSSPTATAEQTAAMRAFATGAMFGTIGGAAKAGLITRLLEDTLMTRGAARKTIDMFMNPETFDQALRYTVSKGGDVGALFGAMVAATVGKASEE